MGMHTGSEVQVYTHFGVLLALLILNYPWTSKYAIRQRHFGPASVMSGVWYASACIQL